METVINISEEEKKLSSFNNKREIQEVNKAN